MCAILGGNYNGNYIEAMRVMAHRGPDARDYFKNNEIVLGFNRLSIVDLSEKGMQPMFTEDKSIGIVFNGEIYGFRLLREELEKKGYFFRSETDTEVILYSYCEWGEKFVEHIDGMFAVAIYDQEKHKLILCRDRVGVKPLYYHINGKEIVFSSELKGIETICADYRFELDSTAIFDYLVFQYIPAPKTMYKNINKLEPSTMLIFDLDKGKIERQYKYWTLVVNPYRGKKLSSEDITQELRALIKESVQDQMVADVKVGTYLSGGMDSSIITAEAANIVGNVDAFCMGFSDEVYDETKYAEAVAEYYRNISLHRFCFDESTLDDVLPLIHGWFDEPFGDSTVFPAYVIANKIKEYVTVALAGEGGDELFGGYTRYSSFAQYIEQRCVDKTQLAEEYGLQTGFCLEGSLKRNEAALRKKLCIPSDYNPYDHFVTYCNSELPPITMAQVIDFNSYLPAMLTKTDRTSMAVSLEVRVPLLSKKIIEFAFGLTEEDRCSAEFPKRILKSAYNRVLPEVIINRKKKGFTTPPYFFIKDDRGYRANILERYWGISV